MAGCSSGSPSAPSALIGVDFEPVLEAWVLPFACPGALVVAAWLVEAKQNVVENIAPVLTRVFTPLTIVMLLAFLGGASRPRAASSTSTASCSSSWT